jgi:hypothetical protein
MACNMTNLPVNIYGLFMSERNLGYQLTLNEEMLDESKIGSEKQEAY